MEFCSRLATAPLRSFALHSVLTGLLFLSAALPAGATVYDLCATLDGAQVVPPVVTAGTGAGVMTYDDATNELCVTLAVSNLNAAATNCHVHGPAAEGSNAGVQVPLPLPDFANFCATITEAQELDLLGGLYYINVHTSSSPGGEIRGQIGNCAVATEEASWSILKSVY